MLDYENYRAIIEIAEGSSTLQDGPVTWDGVKIVKGQVLRRHVMGTYSQYHFRVIGFASPALWMLYDDTEPKWCTEEQKAMPSVVLEEGLGQYEIMSAKDAVETLRMNEFFKDCPTPLG